MRLRRVFAWAPLPVLALLAATGWWDWMAAQAWKAGVHSWEEGGRRRGWRAA